MAGPHKRDCVDRNGLATSKLAHAFVGLPFDADAIDCDAERFCQLRAHRVDVRRELRPLEDDGGTDVADDKPLSANDADRASQQTAARCALPLRTRIRTM